MTMVISLVSTVQKTERRHRKGVKGQRRRDRSCIHQLLRTTQQCLSNGKRK